ncbi:6585_t:CDS:2, partial [Dentiscutata erythropus]
MSKLEELVQERAPQKIINDYCTKHGSSIYYSIFNQITRNWHLQTPQDVYYAVARKVQWLLDYTFLILSPIGKSTFLKYRKTLRHHPTTVAKASRLSFSFTFTEQTYMELNEALKIKHIILLKLFPDNFNNLPNLHINRHHVQNARNFGILVNISVGIKKAVHKIFKSSVPKMNCKNVEFDLIQWHNILQTIRYLIDRETDSHFLHIGQGFRNFTTNLLLQPILSDWYMIQNIQEKDTIDI